MKKIRQEVNDLFHRGMDSHLRLAVTGLSRAGKTAFITSLSNQLLYSSIEDNLPLLSASRDKRLIGAKRVPQTNMMVPRFSYDEAMESLQGIPPQWPEPTKDVSEIRLALRYKPNKGAKRLLTDSSTLYLDIIDYPGEWLLDLPLLEMNFEQWCDTQFASLKGIRADLAKPWLDELKAMDPLAEANEKEIERVSLIYTDYLHRCKEQGLHWVQPGRFVLPGELKGAPVLQFFPFSLPGNADKPQKADKHSLYGMLRARYQEYQTKVVKRFYKEYFSTFDRQIVLIDCLQPLNAGYESFHDMRSALEQIMKSFRYGRSSLLKRLFSPRIDKILFASTKADHVTPEQHTSLLSLLQQMVHPSWQHAAFENIEMECMTIASIRATTTGFVSNGDESVPALRGTTTDGTPLTLYPGEVPQKLPKESFWQDNQFEFNSFRPMESSSDAALNHIRIDKALQYLIGDKLK
ncbi:YcjX family GTP-binding protein [Vibrio algarum]|uniref:YcjX family protein n=1 Tax=Vibrio algarum TaxID=3020714 RepID=A0ABT4YQD9_9VIBR|nr:YcjX family protein [Vibrio sp. KJ40-1]MDB1123776.1 YcjX family protein [Vibrio sp. KJ40-1]